MSRKFSVSLYKAFTTSPGGFRLRPGGGGGGSPSQSFAPRGRGGARKKNRKAGGTGRKSQGTRSRRVSRAAVHADSDPECQGSSSSPVATAKDRAMDAGFGSKGNACRSQEGGVVTARDGNAQSNASIGRWSYCCTTPATDSLRLSAVEARKVLCTSMAASRVAAMPTTLDHDVRSVSYASHISSTAAFAGSPKDPEVHQKHVSHNGAGCTTKGEAKRANRMFSCCATPATDSQRHSLSEVKKSCCTSAAISSCKQEFSAGDKFGLGTSNSAPSSHPAFLARPPRASGGGLKGKSGGVRIFPCSSPLTDSQRFPSGELVISSPISAGAAYPQQILGDARLFQCCTTCTPATQSQTNFREKGRIGRAETLDLRHQKQTRLPMDLSPIHGSMFEDEGEERSEELTTKRSSPPPPKTFVALRRKKAITKYARAQAEKAKKAPPERVAMVKQIKRSQLLFRLCRRKRTFTWRGGVLSNKRARTGKRSSRLLNMGPPLNLLLGNRVP